ncbi:hypothetical protein EF847_00945 [Actinobacteria bacterium YIM 96077]|uniref:DNA modification methylase n=1 Tax=Phytoactinopolyspora halophila TaxID=1981511 RepID=A0A329R0H3_9ACTN|nr:hypothetical protein [Phytoactinopolyspora halophila]AYY11500.1 hypothetical protein EF847_00945 [Actinobacteria bacterium YIM 96077]RAW18017.1 hypothetical protein DPM12_04060 [Phytoactinopolyspora halophila]
MKSAVRRRVLVGVPILALALGGCAVQEQTQGWYPRYDGVTAEAGDVGIRNIVVVSSSDGRATLLAMFANDGADDQLVGVNVADTSATLPDGPVDIPGDGYATLGPDGTRIELTDVDLDPGLLTEVEFRFDRAPRTAVNALVSKAEDRYAHIEFPERDSSGGPDEADDGVDDETGQPEESDETGQPDEDATDQDDG